MKNIKEIFESNPDLLETKEVKELIEQFHLQFTNLTDTHYQYRNKITTLVMHSEFFLKEGISCKEIVERIIEISFPQ